MKEIREVDISMNNRVFTINLAIKDEELIDTIFSALTEYVEKGFPVKIRAQRTRIFTKTTKNQSKGIG